MGPPSRKPRPLPGVLPWDLLSAWPVHPPRRDRSITPELEARFEVQPSFYVDPVTLGRRPPGTRRRASAVRSRAHAQPGGGLGGNGRNSPLQLPAPLRARGSAHPQGRQLPDLSPRLHCGFSALVGSELCDQLGPGPRIPQRMGALRAANAARPRARCVWPDRRLEQRGRELGRRGGYAPVHSISSAPPGPSRPGTERTHASRSAEELCWPSATTYPSRVTR